MRRCHFDASMGLWARGHSEAGGRLDRQSLGLERRIERMGTAGTVCWMDG